MTGATVAPSLATSHRTTTGAATAILRYIEASPNLILVALMALMALVLDYPTLPYSALPYLSLQYVPALPYPLGATWTTNPQWACLTATATATATAAAVY